MKVPVFLHLVLLFAGCNHEVEQDERNLDAWLTTGRVDRVVFIENSWETVLLPWSGRLVQQTASNEKIPFGLRSIFPQGSFFTVARIM
jgi:hypothetical protein